MNIIEKIKTRFFSSDQILIEGDIDETLKFVPIDIIEDILSNKKAVKKIIKSANKGYKVLDDFSIFDIRSAIKEYTSYKYSEGKELTSEEKRVYQKLVGEKIKFDSVDQQVFELLQSDDVVSAMSQLEDNVVKKRLTEMIENKDIISYCELVFENLTLLKQRDELVKNSYRVDQYEEINPDFENIIMQNIPEGLDQISIARAIYIEVCKRVRYDDTFAFEDQDLRKDFVNQIYNKKISELSEKDNKVTCKNCTELYAYLLEKQGIPTYINLKGKHKFAKFIVDGQTIKADSSNVSRDKEGRAMTDLTRAKLGISPAGFECESDFTELDKLLSKEKQNTDSYVQNMIDDIEFIDENIDLEGIIFDDVESLQNLINRILEDTDNSELDSLEMVGYLKSMVPKINQNYSDLISKCCASFYTKEQEYNIQLILSLNSKTKDKGEEKESYSYMIVDRKTGVQVIDKQAFLSQLAEGKLTSSVLCEKNFNNIEGIEFSEVQDYIESISHSEDYVKSISENEREEI